MRNTQRLLAFVLVCLSSLAHASSAISGNIKDLSTTAVTSKTIVRAELKNCAGIPRVISTGIIAPTVKDFTPDGAGAISGTLYNNSEITCGNTTGGTYYRFSILYNGVSVYNANYLVNAAFNLSTATPTTSVASPTVANIILSAPIGSQTITQPAATTFSITGTNPTTSLLVNPTWNNGADLKGLYVNPTLTSAGAGSLVFGLAISGVDYFWMDKNGALSLSANKTNASYLTAGGYATLFGHDSGAAQSGTLGAGLRLGSSAGVTWGSASNWDSSLVAGIYSTFSTPNSIDIGNGGQNNQTATVNAGVFNATSGFRYQTTAAAGNYLRGDGTNFISSPLLPADISGVVPINHGGTGSSSQTWVDLTTNQNIAGTKTFTGAGVFTPTVTNSTPLTISGQSLTGGNNFPALDITSAWNTIGAPALIRGTLTDNAHAAGSMLLDFIVGGNHVFQISPTGGITSNTTGIVFNGASGAPTGAYLRHTGSGQFLASSVAAAGVGTCGTKNWMRSTFDNSGPLCVQPAISDLVDATDVVNKSTSNILAKTLYYGVNTVTFSSTPAIDLALGNTQKITLTGNVTGLGLSNSSEGTPFTFEICQDATGGRTFAWPSAWVGVSIIGTAANTCTTQRFMVVGATVTALSPAKYSNSVNLTSQSTSLAAATVVSTGSIGSANMSALWNLSYYISSQTTCPTPGPANVDVTITWNDGTRAQSKTITTALGGTVLSQGVLALWTDANTATNIQYATTYTACTAGSGTYILRLALNQVSHQ